jgi:type III secretion protein C
MKRKTLISATCLALLLSASVLPLASAAPVRWRSPAVHIAAQGKDLKDVLRDFTASQGITASIAANVQGTVSGEFDMSPQRFLDTLASTFGFVWFYDGNMLTISNANDVTRQVIQMDHATAGQLSSALRSMKIDDPRFPVTYDNVDGTAIVNGPPQYVQLVQEIARRLDDKSVRRTGSSIRVFKLRHAWAADHKVQIDGNSITVQGVAGVLSGMYHVKGGQTGQNGMGEDGSPASGSPNIQRVSPMNDVNGSNTGGGPQQVMPPLPANMGGETAMGGVGGNGMFGSGYGGGYGGGNAGSGGAGNGGFGSGYRAGGNNADASLPIIEADPTTNSVLIRDIPDRIDQYASLINQLDTRPKVIEIEAHIIEIDDDLLRQIGIDWRAHNSHLDVQTGSGTTSQTGYTGTLNPSFGTTTLADNTSVVSSTPVGASITAVLGDAGRYLLARVNASESTTLAKVDATPKVATLDNVEAVMDNKTRFFVRVTGYTAADLYSISTGVSLRVLPMVVQEDGVTRIKLNVHIEDGQLVSDQTVDTLPVITTSEINTQAFVGQGESLLIAGYSTDSKSNGVTNVPGLSKIPIVGALFRNNNDSHSHMERVFLLTPRVLDL